MRKTTKKKIAPIVTAVVVAILVTLYMAPVAVLALLSMGLLSHGERVAVGLPLLCWLLLGGAVIVGVWRALVQRLREIDGGEEEDAGQY